eukprot:CAMPEP_0206481438 /NCGR_PEP_ID=MMETSP0324_2-20121206/38140_1 /ASSEMBLY_ACC=CAM_ASM_000836 /TAXON_ID=2866 /ORGANISM="Crypthecodinium cohnii, Strain Seligo" /LENGTH=100 /DNA_ID=CAMNT_0053958917 /DNA_START=254 /DNA_END=556 /DNA_ORIENTATION=+
MLYEAGAGAGEVNKSVYTSVSPPRVKRPSFTTADEGWVDGGLLFCFGGRPPLTAVGGSGRPDWMLGRLYLWGKQSFSLTAVGQEGADDGKAVGQQAGDDA